MLPGMTVILTAVLTLTSVVVCHSKQETAPKPDAFLSKAAEGQQAEIMLGQLAVQRASSNQVKQFGTQMIEDHKKASLEIQKLSAKEGLHISTRPSDTHQEATARLSQLGGKDFDRAYIDYMLRDHTKDVKEFEQDAMRLTDPEIKQWASSALPVLKEHLQKAQSIASSLGIDAKETK